MSVEKVNGLNNLSNKTLRKADRVKAQPEKSSPTSAKSSKRAESPQEEMSVSTKSDVFSAKDVVEITSQNDVMRPDSYKDIVEGVVNSDSVEISWRDPEVVEKIRELIEMIKAKKEAVSQRIEAARILLMERAYDNNDELRNTAEAILRGEQVDDADLKL